MTSYASYLKKAAEEAERGNAKKATATAEEKAEETFTKAELTAALEEIENEYVVKEDGELPEGVRYERIEYDEPTDAELLKTAEAELAAYREEELADIGKEADDRRAAANERKANAARTLAEEEERIAEDHGEAVRSLENDMLRRGLTRSSIASGGASELERGRADAVSEARLGAAEESAAADAELDALEKDMEKALNAFDIAYAARVAERMAELTEEREKKRNEAIEYNNKMAEKEREDALEAAGSGTLTAGEVPEELRGEYNEAKYEVVRRYLYSLDADAARVAVRNDPDIRNALSDYYYYRLYREFGDV